MTVTRRRFICLPGALFLASCAITADDTSGRSTCEIHGLPMEVRELPCKPGTSVYLADFSAALRTQFPHHDGVRFAEDHAYLSCHTIRTYVCPECAKAYREWLEKHPGTLGEGSGGRGIA